MSAAVFVTGDQRWIVARFDQALYRDVLGAVPGATWDKARGAWRWPLSERVAVDLTNVLGYWDDVALSDPVAELVAQAWERDVAREHKLAAPDDVPLIELETFGAPEHWVHQRRAFHFARNLSAAGIFIGMGGGKSRVAVDLVRDAGDERILILCPKNVIGVWPKQFELYAPDRYRIVAPTKGTVTKRAEEIERVLRLLDDQAWPLVTIVNYDSAWREPMAKLLTSLSWDRVILDESHRVKSAGGKASKFVAKLSRRAKRRLCLTGTPMPHSPLDVFGQYRFLDPGIFGTNKLKFRNRYAVMGGYPALQWNPETHQMEMMPTEVVGYQNEDELAERTYSIAYRIADEGLDAILGLVPPLHEIREVELTPPEVAVYRKMYKDFCADLGAGLVTADNALVRLLRLAQVTSGHLPELDDKSKVLGFTVLGTSKAEALEEALEDIPPGEPVVVFARFTHDLNEIERITAKLGRSYAELSGRRRDGLADDSTLVAGVEIVGVNIRSGGEGVDFSRSHYCVFYSVGFSLGDYEQALKRTHRPGQVHRVLYLHLVATIPATERRAAARTIDGQTYEALRDHKDVVEYVLGLAS